MPYKPKKPCCYPGCPELVDGERYCDKHKREHDKQRNKETDSHRGTAAQRGYDSQWQKHRKQFLCRNPLCVRCQQQGFVVCAAVVDHIQPHKGDKRLFWDTSNHQALCTECHNKKTAKEDGGYGNNPGKVS